MFDKMPVDVIVLEETSSTMKEAETRRATLERPTWILAKRQTAGQGRRGASWRHPEGNFAATLVYRPQCSPLEAGLRSFLTACALREVLAQLAPEAEIALKWPNDVLFNGGKIAGILLQSTLEGEKIGWLSIGIGVNLAEAPPDEGQAFAPVSLQGRIGPEAFLSLLAASFAQREALFEAEGFAPIREEWLSFAARLGQEVIARLSREEVVGVFSGLDLEGNLLLETSAGPRAIAAAEVFFGA